jgi:NTE family protein
MTTTMAQPSARRMAMILSGGGARGAYEVGVLSYVFDILSGTSVGAINACYLAAHLADPVLGLRRLVHLWEELEMRTVLGFGVRQIIGIPRLLLGGGGKGAGIFDVTPMSDLVHREISWRAVTRVLRRRQLRALSISTTEVATGRTVVFMQVSPDLVIPATAPPRTLFRADHIGPQHALASAAIPLLFPPVQIGSELYLDGGLRQNTPIAPALRLGATHIFTVGSSREVKGVRVYEGASKKAQAPGAAFLLGKILNAFLLDHVDADLELLNRLNRVIEDGTRAFGPTFTDSMSREANKRGAPAYRHVHNLTIRPSEDIGRLASEHVRKGRFRGDPLVAKRLFQVLDMGVGDEADLASYLLFDGAFCKQLIEMGRADAKARKDDLIAFFGDKSDDGGVLLDGDELSGTYSGTSLAVPQIGT